MVGTSFYNDTVGVHSDSLNLIQNSVHVAPLEPRTKYIEVPHRDGALDLTEFLGSVKYNNRKIDWEFTTKPGVNLAAARRSVEEQLNGKLYNIILDEEPTKIYRGRITVNDFARDNQLMKITLSALCDPQATTPTFGIVVQPQNITVAAGETAMFKTVAAAPGNITYQWYWSQDGNSFSVSSAEGNKTPNLYIAASNYTNGRYYKCLIKSGGASIYTNVVRLTVV